MSSSRQSRRLVSCLRHLASVPVWLVCWLGVVLPSVRADLVLPALVADGMVLQRDLPVPIWGWADPGTAVSVDFAGQHREAVTGEDGRWQVTLDPLAASADSRNLVVVAGAETRTVADVLVGEVWICSGQSNMQFETSRVRDAAAELAPDAATFPAMRLFQVRGVVAKTPARDVQGRWQACTPETAKPFSAVGFLFGRELHTRLKVPVGLIHASQGWTPGEAWMSHDALVAEPELRYIADRWDAVTANQPQALAEYKRRLADREAALAVAKTARETAVAAAAVLAANANPTDADKATASAANDAAVKAEKAVPGAPSSPPDPMFIHRASGFYNGCIAPLAPVAMRGVIWYQGETNDSRGYQYRVEFPALIRDWRHTWGGREFPFLFVQVANVLPPDPEPVNSEWAELRESQALALALPATGMAVTIDIGEANDVHPTNKQDVARRLARVARARVYGEAGVIDRGPTYRAMTVDGSAVRVAFDNLGGGLVCKGEALQTFALAGADRRWYWADAHLDGDTVVVTSPNVPAPVAVRYAWANNPAGCNLYNAAGLPAVPFRSDDWTEKTRGATKLFIDN